MNVLMRIPDEGGSPDNTDQNELALACFRHFAQYYDDSFSHTEAYLAPCLSEKTAAKELDFHDGRTDRQYVLDHAEAWNSAIELAVTSAVSYIQDCRAQPTVGSYLDSPPTAKYKLKKATMALDDEPFAFADWMLLVGDTLKTVLSEQDAAAIQSRPENYAVLTVHPK